MHHSLHYIVAFIASSVVFLFSVVATTYSQNQDSLITISPRIGVQIDREERDYFLLFPNIKEFVSAQVFKNGSEHYSCRMQYRKENSIVDSTISMNKVIIEKLKQLIESYEKDAQDFSSEAVFDSPGNRYFSDTEYGYRMLEKKGIIGFQELILGETEETSITTSESNSLEGILLYAGDSLAIMWKCNGTYDWRMSDSCISAVRARDISKLNFHEHGRFWTGAFIGGFFSAGILSSIIYFHGWTETTFEVRFFATAVGLVAGLVSGGILGGLISNQSSWNNRFLINGDQNIFIQHLKEIKRYSLFPDKAPPEIFRSKITLN